MRVRVWDCDYERFVVAGFGLGDVEGEENGFEPHEGRWLQEVDAGEVEADEDYKVELGSKEREVL